MKGLASFVLGLVLVVLFASRLGAGAGVCPAVAWSNTLTIELRADWPQAHAVRVGCPTSCGLVLGTPDDEPDTQTRPLARGSTTVSFEMGAPDSVTATVLAADGAVLTVAELYLDWVRVGGSTECGGPAEARATVPAP
ncbi:hypothetical protein [Modestobacter italicus]|uniref:hypothetical protein n=1 Tax=Modestobacter italicus (strain DSM 44449 / CECT 9708 / BC 501) TaxID=2732864 RepID=UPI001C94332B|nr:hypothetical protein [Modestobacter italicus]